jgi:hypothetical protein
VLEVLFTCLRLDEQRWAARDGGGDVTVYGAPAPIPPHSGASDPAAEAALFREGVAALAPILAGSLQPATLEAVRAAAAGAQPALSDELWVTVVEEIAAAHRKGSVSREQLVQAAAPLYLGRVATFHAANAGAPPPRVEQALEELCLRFERSRPELVRLWAAAAR